ncbi:hypothetical protein D3C77_502360 [compost metagenome]
MDNLVLVELKFTTACLQHDETAVHLYPHVYGRQVLQLQDLAKVVFVTKEIALAKHHVVQARAPHGVRGASWRRQELTQQQVALELGDRAVVSVGAQQLGQPDSGHRRLVDPPVVAGEHAQVLADIAAQYLLRLPEREQARRLWAAPLSALSLFAWSGHGFRS